MCMCYEGECYHCKKSKNKNMKPGEYIQMFEFFAQNNESFIQKYCHSEGIDWLTVGKRFDELRELHLKFKKEGDQYSIYPHLDLKQLNYYKQIIIDVCMQFNIRPTFPDLKSIDFRKGFHCYYYYNSINVTNLIVFNKTRDKSKVSRYDFEL